MALYRDFFLKSILVIASIFVSQLSISAEISEKRDSGSFLPHELLSYFVPKDFFGYQKSEIDRYDDPGLGASVSLYRKTDHFKEVVTIYLYDFNQTEITNDLIHQAFFGAVKEIRGMLRIPFAENGYSKLDGGKGECESPVLLAEYFPSEEEAERLVRKTESMSPIGNHVFLLVARSNKHIYKMRYTAYGQKPEGKLPYLANPIGVAMAILTSMGRC